MESRLFITQFCQWIALARIFEIHLSFLVTTECFDPFRLPFPACSLFSFDCNPPGSGTRNVDFSDDEDLSYGDQARISERVMAFPISSRASGANLIFLGETFNIFAASSFVSHFVSFIACIFIF